MSKKNNEVVTEEEVMEGEVIEEELSIDDELDRLEALVKAEKAKRSNSKRKKRILIGAGVGVAGLLGTLYIIGKKSEEKRREEEAANAEANGGYVLYDSTGAALPNNGMFTADGSTTTL